jgi:hypothetical protein
VAHGIACPGIGNSEDLKLKKYDPVNYVRQGALISYTLILIQQTDLTCPPALYTNFGTILVPGIIDA